jgi:hypothetical protein
MNDEDHEALGAMLHRGKVEARSTENTDLVDRVARAICWAQGEPRLCSCVGECQARKMAKRDPRRLQARAAIAVMFAELAAERSRRELFESAAAREQREKASALLELAAEREEAARQQRMAIDAGVREAKLREALEPFAVAAENFESFPIKDAEQWFAYSGTSSQKENGKGAITVGDLRRARAVLAEIKKLIPEQNPSGQI